MKKEDVIQIAKDLMTKHGLIEQGWKFLFHDTISAMGWCSYKKKEISLNTFFVENESKFEVVDTILHEIAHALVGSGNGHNKIWKAKAIEIGCTGERCYHGKVGVNESKRKPRKVKAYVGTCPNCGGKRHSKVRKNMSCGKCDKIYNPEYKLIWEEYKGQ